MRLIGDAPDYWVPEDLLFKTDMDCIDAFPDQAAAGVFNGEWQRRYDLAVEALKWYAGLRVDDELANKTLRTLGELE